MAEAVGIAAAALAFLTAANDCLTVFRAVRQNTSESHRVLNLMLEAQAFRFGEWCDALGVQDMIGAADKEPETWRDSAEAKAFQVRLRVMLRFDNDGIATQIVEVLADMKNIFTKARGKISPVINEKTQPTGPAGTKPAKIKLLCCIPMRKKEHDESKESPKVADKDKQKSTSSVGLFSKAAAIFTDVKWVALDQKTFEHLLKQVTAINDILNTYLPVDTRTAVSRRVQGDILRNPSVETDSAEMKEALQGDHEVQSLAVLKREVRKVKDLDAVDKGDEEPHGSAGAAVTRLQILDVDDFPNGTTDFGPVRSISQRIGRPVLLEWTHYGKPVSLDHFYRRANLMYLLRDANVYRKLQTLRPEAVVRDKVNSRIGIVFEIPGKARSGMQEKTLFDLLKTKKCEIGQRLLLAERLSKALHSLQMVNWLHKSVRSDNILYFEGQNGQDMVAVTLGEVPGNGMPTTADSGAKAGLDPPAQPAAVAQPSASMLLRLPELYLMGWNISRPDQLSEMSESVSVSTQGYKSAKELIRLSSHPDSLKKDDSGRKARFRPEYDIYSFGLVLLEIGLWKPLSSLRRVCTSDEEFRQRAVGEYCDMLLSNIGRTYWRATKRCLLNDFDRKLPEGERPYGEGGESGEMPLSVAFERQVVSELERSAAAVAASL
ncbi:hypothetical protein RB595_005368 [Gaeumannomyces hyphopodioides]